MAGCSLKELSDGSLGKYFYRRELLLEHLCNFLMEYYSESISLRYI
jgi:hypothetical protein